MSAPDPAPLSATAGEHGVLRLFALDMPREQVKFLHEPGALDDILGVTGLAPEDVEIFPVSDLDDLGLRGYLIEGHAIPPDQIDTGLSGVTGSVMVVHSRAFGGAATTLKPAASLTHLGTYTATPTDWSAQPEPTPASAQPRSGSPQSPRADRSRSRRIGGGIFAVVMLFVALLLYMVIR